MTSDRSLRYGALLAFLLSLLQLHAQSGIELPKPNTGSLGIHVKFVQSIPVSSRVRPVDIFFSADGKSIVVPVTKYTPKLDKEEHRNVDNFDGIDLEVHNLVSGNTMGSLGVIGSRAPIISPDLSVAATCDEDKHGLGKLEFYRLGGSGTLQPSTSTNLAACDGQGWNLNIGVRTGKGFVDGSGIGTHSVLSPGGAYLAMDGSASDHDVPAETLRQVQIFDAKTAKLLTTVTTSDKITHLHFSADASMLLAVAQDGTVHVWAVPSGQLIRVLDAQEAISWASFIPGRPAIVALGASSVFVWDVNTGQRINFFREDMSNCSFCGFGAQVALTPDGRTLILSGGGFQGVSAVRISGAVYDLQSGSRVSFILRPDDDFNEVEGVAISSDGTLVAMFDQVGYQQEDYIVRIWRIERE